MQKEFLRAGRLDFISPQLPLRWQLGKTELVVFQVDGEFFAVENNCPHQHFSVLHQGEVNNCTVTCPMHGWNFDLRTGNATNGNGKLKTYSVEIREQEIWVEKPNDEDAFVLF
jgi:nitrite reductase/ring-hydroxylating ferredoxin subunit